MLAFFLLLLACGEAPVAPVAEVAEMDTGDAPARLEASLLLARRSLDLRGRRPTLDELDAVEADPAALDALTAAYLDDPALPQQMAWLWNDSLHTAIWPSTYTRFGAWTPEQWSAVGQEPLQIIAAVIAEDRPFTEVVTEGRTQSNASLRALYGLSGEGEGWTWTDYPDGRPMAGLLSTNVMWLRVTADAVNYNRARANALARTLLCADFLDRPGSFSFDIDPSSLSRVERAVALEPVCLSCHAALDPLASLFGGFAERSDSQPLPGYLRYSARSADWFAARQPPAYFGVPVADLHEASVLIAADPRFARCAARRFAEGLLGEPLDDLYLLDGFTEAFLAADLVVRPYLAALVEHPAYTTPEPRLLRSEQVGSALSAFLGLEASLTEGLGPLTWSVDHRVLSGGTDDDTVTTRAPNLGLGPALVMEWSARAAAGPALSADLARAPVDRVLFTVEGADVESPAEATVRAQLSRWMRALTSQPVDAEGDSIDGLYALYLRGATPLSGYTLALQATLRHPAVMVY